MWMRVDGIEPAVVLARTTGQQGPLKQSLNNSAAESSSASILVGILYLVKMRFALKLLDCLEGRKAVIRMI